MTLPLTRLAAILLLCTSLAACHTTQLGQSVGFPTPQRGQAR